MSAKEEDMSEETEEEEESEEESGETEESEETESEEEDEEDEEDAKRAEATRAAARAEEDEEALAKQAMKQELQGSAAAPATGEFVHQLVNEQHDAEFEVKDTENILTPPQSTKKSGDAPLNAMKNNTHDAAIELTGETHQVVTPRAAESAGMEERNLKDQAHDIAFDVDQDDDARHIKTPPQQPVAGAVPADDGKALKNDTHDVAFPVDDGSSVSSDEEAAKAEALKQAQQAQQAQQAAAANTSQPQQQKPAALPAVETDTGDSAQNQVFPPPLLPRNQPPHPPTGRQLLRRRGGCCRRLAWEGRREGFVRPRRVRLPAGEQGGQGPLPVHHCVQGAGGRGRAEAASVHP